MNIDLVPAVALSAGWATTSLVQGRRLRTARRDPLTGVWTRAGFERRARRLLAHRAAVVVLVDVDDFKAVNDTHGHAVGDVALAAVADRLADWAGRRGVVGRLGGDEFVAVRPWGGVPASSLAEDLHRRLHITLPGVGEVTASVGAVVTSPGTPLTTALGHADHAMYQVKRTGLVGWAVAVLRPVAPTPRRRHRTRREAWAITGANESGSGGAATPPEPIRTITPV